MQIREWIDRALKISIRDGVDLQNAVKLAEEICRLSAGAVHGGAVNFISQARAGGKSVDDQKLATCRNYFYRLILILKEQWAADAQRHRKIYHEHCLHFPGRFAGRVRRVFANSH